MIIVIVTIVLLECVLSSGSKQWPYVLLSRCWRKGFYTFFRCASWTARHFILVT